MEALGLSFVGTTLLLLLAQSAESVAARLRVVGGRSLRA